MQHVQKLPLILMQPLDLHVKKALRVKVHTVGAAHIRRQPLLVLEFDRAKLRENLFVIVEAHQLLELPRVLRKSASDELREVPGQSRVRLTKPASVGNAVCDVDKPALV